MADVDQEAMMAQWEAELAAEAEAAAAPAAGAGGGGADAGDLAAEWEAMVGGSGGSMGERFNMPVGAERILNQDEIDSLLGFDLSEDDYNERSGIRAIINSAMVSYERLPMLEIVFDRLVRLMTTSLRNFTSDNVEVSLDNISSIRFGD